MQNFRAPEAPPPDPIDLRRLFSFKEGKSVIISLKSYSHTIITFKKQTNALPRDQLAGQFDISFNQLLRLNIWNN